jgi:hypothetical protein
MTSVARLANQPMIIVSKPNLPVKDLADFIELAKASPGKLSFGTLGPGTPQHFGAEMLSAQTGICRRCSGIPRAGVRIAEGRRCMARFSTNRGLSGRGHGFLLRVWHVVRST